MSQAELTAYVQVALHKAGIETVLSGGSCVSVWSDNAYVSDDIDLIVDGFSWRTKIRAAMLDLASSRRIATSSIPNRSGSSSSPMGRWQSARNAPRRSRSVGCGRVRCGCSHPPTA